ncbi:hypothetical protein RHS01_01294 [Rhizoctonia solani]|uniref:Uncharacterized protein n=1 Tax=Rhizoctonia solani TaxID=456999 RepID=A0A8H7INZ1_9AGAM|nr:hypothetical protein RHS01_01294 [Rhizoctonia solani]
MKGTHAPAAFATDHHFYQSLDYVAAIFRCACPDLPGKPINLAALMLGSNTSLRWFACLDVLHSILSAKPTHFQYDVPFSIELCNQVQASASFQAVQGVPDQLIMFFAWVNSLCETPAGDSPEVIAWAEEILPQIRFAGGETGDALLHLTVVAVYNPTTAELTVMTLSRPCVDPTLMILGWYGLKGYDTCDQWDETRSESGPLFGPDDDRAYFMASLIRFKHIRQQSSLYTIVRLES